MNRLRVAMDGRRLTGGVGRGVAGLLPYLAAEVDIVLLTDARLPPLDIDATVEQVSLSVPGKVPQLLWLELAVGGWLRRHPRLFHGIFNTMPLRWRGPSVVSIHDLSFEVFPVDFGPVQRRAWQLYVRHAARHAGHVLTTSDFTAAQLRQIYGIGGDRVTVIPNALTGPFGADQAERWPAVREETGLEVPFVVSLGGAPRRHLPVAIGAWRRARELGHDIGLAVVGDERPPHEEGMTVLGFVDDDTWGVVLASSEAFIYATAYEGFGMPALESMASGTPVVCARSGSVVEILGEAGVWAPAATAEALGDTLAGLLAEPARAAESRRRGLERAAAAPTWEDAAEAVLAAYHRVDSMHR